MASFLRRLSAGQVQTGLHLHGRFSYSSVCTGLVTLLLIAWLLMMDITAIIDTYGKNFQESEVTQGPFEFESGFKQSDIASYLIALNPNVVLSSSTDSDYCRSHGSRLVFTNGQAIDVLDLNCTKIASSEN